MQGHYLQWNLKAFLIYSFKWIFIIKKTNGTIQKKIAEYVIMYKCLFAYISWSLYILNAWNLESESEPNLLWIFVTDTMFTNTTLSASILSSDGVYKASTTGKFKTTVCQAWLSIAYIKKCQSFNLAWWKKVGL
jgi:hypothetical protein